MAIEGIYASASALRLNERRLGQGAHNLANLSTPGYQPRRVEQAELAGGGVQAVATSPLGGGPILASDRPLDLALDGGGFFVLGDGQGGQVYSRAGNFMLDAQGQLVDPLGRPVQPAITLPAQTAQVYITPEGQVQALAGDGTVLASGQLQTAIFGNSGGLTALGGNVYAATPASGPPVTAPPGTPGHGLVVAGASQASGTDIVDEMLNLTQTERELEANLRTLRAHDEMVGTILDVVA